MSQENLHRALCLAEALLKTLEKKGYTITISNGWRTATTKVNVLDEPVGVRLDEKLQRVSVGPPTVAKFRNKTWQWENGEKVLMPSGLLRLMLYEPKGSYIKPERIWIDGPKKGKIEDHFEEIIDSFEQVAQKLKRERQEQEERWAEQRRKREEEARIKAAEGARRRGISTRTRRLYEEARSWEECATLRRYVKAVEETLRRSADGWRLSPEQARWIKWAKEYIDSIDPLLSLDRCRIEVRDANGDQPDAEPTDDCVQNGPI